MNALDYIRAGLNASAGLSLTLLDDMRDAPMQAPTAKGGNPPHWILGHLAYAESNVIEHIIRGNENPLIEWKGVFGAQQQPGADAQAYPAWDQVRAKFDEVRANTMAFVDGLTEAVFQFESRGMQGMLREAKPTRLEDLIALNAMFRPGPTASRTSSPWRRCSALARWARGWTATGSIASTAMPR